MRLLLFSDLHCDADATRRLVERSRDVDVLVGAGDFARVRRQIEICPEILRDAPRPAVLVPGNNETLDELKAACRFWSQAHVLHGSGVTIDGVPFFGLGGGVPVTPFGDWSYDFTEEQAAELLAGCPEGAVLISHSPPRGAVDRDGSGRSVGSTAVRDAILRLKPRLVVCGHVHASWSMQETIGETTVVNAGPTGIEWDV